VNDTALSRVPPLDSIARWLASGLIFLGINTGVLYLAVQFLRLAVPVATVASAEVCTILRFLLNEIWVFKTRKMSWLRLWRYHLANAVALVVWWIATNVLNRLGLNYIFSSILAVGFSTGISFTTNFFWIWKTKRTAGHTAAE